MFLSVVGQGYVMCVCHPGLRITVGFPVVFATHTGETYKDIWGRFKEKKMVGKNKGGLCGTVLEEEKDEEGGWRWAGERSVSSLQWSSSVLCTHGMPLLYARP